MSVVLECNELRGIGFYELSGYVEQLSEQIYFMSSRRRYSSNLIHISLSNIKMQCDMNEEKLTQWGD